MDISYEEFKEVMLEIYHSPNKGEKDIWERTWKKLGIVTYNEIYYEWFEEIMEETYD